MVGSGSTQNLSFSGDSVTEATVLYLMPSTTYSFEVAAENSAGIGVYGNMSTIVKTILMSKFMPLFFMCTL